MQIITLCLEIDRKLNFLEPFEQLDYELELPGYRKTRKNILFKDAKIMLVHNFK